MIATSASEPLVIHILVPLRIQSLPSFTGAGHHAARVGAVVGLGQAEAADRLALASLGSQWVFCSSLPNFEDRVHHQAALHAGEGADARIAPLELLHEQAVGHVVQLRAAVAGRHVRPEDAQLRHLRYELFRESGARRSTGRSQSYLREWDARIVLSRRALPGCGFDAAPPGSERCSPRALSATDLPRGDRSIFWGLSPFNPALRPVQGPNHTVPIFLWIRSGLSRP